MGAEEDAEEEEADAAEADAAETDDETISLASVATGFISIETCEEEDAPGDDRDDSSDDATVAALDDI